MMTAGVRISSGKPRDPRHDAPGQGPLSVSSRQLRLASGLVLLTYITMHLVTHTFGLWSLDLAERGLGWTKALWQSWPGTVALYGAAAAHFALALRTIYQRRHWGLPLIEIIRLWAGFSLPLLLISHVVTTRLTLAFFGVPSDYRRIVGLLVASGNEGWQIALLAPGWLHGCLGLWISLRHVELMRRLRPLLIAFVVALPLLSAAGFGRMTEAVAGAPPPAQSAPLDAAAAAARRDRLAAWQRGITTAYLVSLLGAFVGGQIRNRIERKAGQTLA